MPAIYGQPALGSEFDPVVQRAQQFVELCFARAARQVTDRKAPKTDPKSVEGVLAAFLSARLRPAPSAPVSAPVRKLARSLKQRAEAIAGRLAAQPQQFGPLARVDLGAAQPLARQLGGGKLFDDLIHKNAPLIKNLAVAPGAPAAPIADGVREMLRRIRPGQKPMPAPGPGTGPVRHTQLQLELLRVVCDDPEGWEIADWDKDHISLGGKAYDSAGTQEPVMAFAAGEFELAGDSFSFPGTGRVFARYDLTRTGGWPRVFYASLAMAERDADGGFIEFLVKLWAAIDEAVIDALTLALLAATTGAAVGGTTGSAAPVAGTLVGIIVGALVGLAVGMVLDSLNDDLFQPVEAAPLVLESASASFGQGGAKVSPEQTAQFGRDGAQYRVTYRWRLV